MKLSALSVLLAGAGLLQANASPLRVVLISPEQAPPTLDSETASVAQLKAFPGKFQVANGTRSGCAGARGRKSQSLNSKTWGASITISNTLRQALGLPLIEEAPKSHVHHHHKQDGGDEGPVRHKHHHHHHEEQGEGDEFKSMENGQVSKHHGHKHHLHGKGKGKVFRFHGGNDGFLKRIHFALMALGPWEGRAVAFVIGCGLGVLLRMFWVLSIVVYRTVKGQSDQDNQTHDYVPVLNQLDAEEIYVSPPVYILDEKAPLKEELTKAPTVEEN